MPDTPQRPDTQAKKGFFERMSLFQKIILFIIVIIALVVSLGVAFGGLKDFYQFFFYLIVLVGVVIVGYIVYKATSLIFAPRFFSPREDLRTKLTNMAKDYKPDNVNNLYFIGDVGKKRVLGGRIIGLLGLPYYTGKVKRYEKDVIDKDGKTVHKKNDVVYSEVKDFQGKKIPKYENITLSKDGDTLFVVKKEKFFGLFGNIHLIRAHFDYHSTLHGDVEIYDINPVPYGFYEYPFKQMQDQVTAVMVQNQIETILATHEHQHDLISQSVDSAIYFNPVYRYSLKQASEIPEE